MNATFRRRFLLAPIVAAVTFGALASAAHAQEIVASGAKSTLTWSSTNTTSCTASGGWSGSEPVSGSMATSALTTITKYTITCTGPGGSASQSATVTVSATAPSVSIRANRVKVIGVAGGSTNGRAAEKAAA